MVGVDVMVDVLVWVVWNMKLLEVFGVFLLVCLFVLVFWYFNGVVVVFIIGCNVGCEYVIEKVVVLIFVDCWDIFIGLFGYFKEVIMVFFFLLKIGKYMVFV